MKNRKHIVGFTLAAVGMIVASLNPITAYAAATPVTVEGSGGIGFVPGDTATTLQEVNVVALKQQERLRSEAVSATTVGQADLERLGVASMKGISDVVPNFYIPDYGSRITSSLYVRGIGARMDQPAVGLSVDNVPYLNKNSYDFDLADIETVEMLRGPQSTLFGRNTIGGLINITTLSPLRWQGWRIALSGGTGNDCRASLGWYHKFNPRTALAVIGNFSYLGGFFRNEYDGKYLDHERSGGVRTKFVWRISDAVTLQNALSTSLLRQGGYPYEYVETGRISYNDPCFYHRFGVQDGLTLNWRAENFTMTSVTSLQWLDDNMTLDQDFLEDPYFTLTQKQKDFGLTEDIVFRGDAGDRYHWLAGAFGFYKHLDMTAPVTFKDKGISELIEKHRNDANPDYPIAWDSRQFALNSDFTLPSGGVAVYHQSRYDAGKWHFAAGIRLDWEMTRLRYRSYCSTGYEVYHRTPEGLTPYSHADINIDETGRLRRSYLNWMPKITVLFDLNGEGTSNVYANVSKGWKAGGFNTQMFSDVLQQRLMGMMGIGAQYDVDKIVGYRPEYSWNYELGAHLTFLEERLKIDLSAFYIDCHDQQLTMFPDGTTTGRIMTNAGKTRSIGGELAMEMRVTERLGFNVSYGFTDARFVRFSDGRSNYKGNCIPYAPRNTLFLQGVWEIPVRGSKLESVTLDVNMRGTGRIYWNEANTLHQPFYALLGASVSLKGKIWELQVWGRNLTNTRYNTFYFMSMGNEFLQRGRPVQGGATLLLTI